ncbi:MAG: hypothetical protein JXB60_07570 [Candidatus Cloacimonetes bacterium]|nr:hypothetical protein [Candidatus Cloacimonadota bacterium]
MKWIIPLLGLLFMLFFFIYLLCRKNKPKETRGIILTALALAVYHLGDVGLWGGWYYELVRRIASVGFYFLVPFLLLTMYMLLPKENRGWFIKVFTWLMIIPWIIALVIVYKSPLIFLEEMGGGNESMTYALVLAFIIAFIFIISNGFRTVKLRSDETGKNMGKKLAVSLIVMLILYLLLWGSIDAFGYDATYLFAVANIIWALIIWPPALKEK